MNTALCGPHHTPYTRGVKLIFTGGHIILVVAFKGPKVILGLYKCNHSLTRGKELSAAAGWKQGAGLDKTRRAGLSLRALCLPPVPYRKESIALLLLKLAVFDQLWTGAHQEKKHIRANAE